ncbi:TetR/AcrR family transcriptional regulator [Pseudovibrio sp. SPO723]|uniref:TetR/AcrR family transcriptional regulator n=1 Tax=Nesiotobacter zosterae TaxID=392721 RepID=UPI0029C3B619|nr:TetR/AcrR family transcriptional regulator [Pseudovibrio sp. SPO723]MDX5595189.1 TetR/AcrR family transcriptional regulator [Pseudovibrio sp. SPO723]
MSKKDDILEAAMRLFNEHGYTAVGVDLIRDEAKVSKMTLYKYFKNKDKLVEAVLELRHQRFSSSLVCALDGLATPEQRLQELFDWHLRWFLSRNFFGCMFIKAMGEFQGNDELQNVSQNHKRWLAELLEQILKDMGVSEAKAKGVFLQVVLDGMIVNANLFRSYNQLDETWRITCQSLGLPYTPLKKPEDTAALSF